MTDYLGAPMLNDEFLRTGFEFPGRVAEAYQQAPQKFGDQTRVVLGLGGEASGTYLKASAKPAVTPEDRLGDRVDLMTHAFDWFESFHIIPREFDLGNLLSRQVRSVEIYSAFRKEFHDWTAFVNNSGNGVALVSAPSLPYTFPPQSGLDVDIEIDLDGPASVDSTVDFVFDVPQTISLILSFQRIVTFVPDPEVPYSEVLEFVTDINPHRDGTEQRIALRRVPRQVFEWTLRLDDGRSRSAVHNTLFEWQGRIFGVPAWSEQIKLTAPAAINDTTVTTSATANTDFRVDGLVIVYQDQFTFDVAQITAIGANSIDFDTPLAHSFTVGAKVAPVRIALMDPDVRGTRFPSADATLQPRFVVTENGNDLADVSAWPSLNSKVLISGCNIIRDEMAEAFLIGVSRLDSIAGQIYQESTWSSGKRAHQLTFVVRTVAELFTLRQLVHALKGKQRSFYVSTFSNDLQPVQDLASGSNLLTVANVGYARFIQARSPRDAIRVMFNDGTAPVIFTVASASEVDEDTETITINGTWAATYPVATVRRIEFLEKVRLDTDRLLFLHAPGGVNVTLSVPVITVLE